jgi:hypothetical protein
VWFLHLVSDVHQPLNATARFNALNPHGDQGGNKAEVCSPGCGNKLHSYWDGLLGSGNSAQEAIKAAAKISGCTSIRRSDQ